MTWKIIVVIFRLQILHRLNHTRSLYLLSDDWMRLAQGCFVIGPPFCVYQKGIRVILEKTVNISQHL
jgi:hypothetical protein